MKLIYSRISANFSGTAANAAAFNETGLPQSFQHMVTGFLRAELRGESSGIKERRETPDNCLLALGILAPTHLPVRGRKKRMCEQLNAAPGAPGESSITSLDGLGVMTKKIMCHAHVLGRNNVGAVEAERAFEPR